MAFFVTVGLFVFYLDFLKIRLNIALAPPFCRRKEKKTSSRSKTALPFPQAVLFHHFSTAFQSIFFISWL